MQATTVTNPSTTLILPAEQLHDAAHCKLVKHCEQGFSFESFAHRVGVSDRTLRNWRDQHADFSEACERAKAASLYFFEKLLIQNLNGKSRSSKINPALLIFTLKTRFSAIYGQPSPIIQSTLIDQPDSFEFKGRRVTVADLKGNDLREAAEIFGKQIEANNELLKLLDSPSPFEGRRRAAF